jgi:hypothetical protein
MMSKSLLIVCIIAVLVAGVVGESAISKLKAAVEAGKGAAPCDKVPAGPAPPRQFLDIRLPHVVDDYHPPVGGFNPTDIPSKEVDVAARKILREIQKAEKEARENGDAPQKEDPNGILTTEEHKALKQLLLDADILVRAASKALSENGPIEFKNAKKVAASAVKKAAKAEKKAKALKKVAAPAQAKTAAASQSGKAATRPVVKAAAPPAAAKAGQAKTAAATQSGKAATRT